MATVRSVDFLPQIFQTEVNNQFLSATLDQLIQEPEFKKTQGFIGRVNAPGATSSDRYVVEPTQSRANYQLEPGVVSLEADTNQIKNAITYPGMNDAIGLAGGVSARPDRLYQSEYYTWDPFVNFDSLVNFSQYFWLPHGPDAVTVSTSGAATTGNFTVAVNQDSYNFSSVTGNDPVIDLVRGGNYSFQRVPDADGNVSQFWIQTAPGVSGQIPSTPNLSSREIAGVVNNGSSAGAVIFNVPLKNAQGFYYDLQDRAPVDLLCTLKFNQVNNVELNQFLDTFGGIDGISSLDGRTLVFSQPMTDTSGWSQVLPVGGNDQTVPVPESSRYQVWKITYVDVAGQVYLSLSQDSTVDTLTKFKILYGQQFSNTQWYKNAAEYFDRIPALTASQDVLYYQDGSNPDVFGQIRLVDPVQSETIFINDILGSDQYTSPNGVVFTNGLKVRFLGDVEPRTYTSGTLPIVVTETQPGSNYITTESTVGLVPGQPIVFESGIGGIQAGVTYYVRTVAPNGVQFTISDTLFGAVRLLSPGTTAGTNATVISDKEFYVEGVGTGIQLIPVDTFDTGVEYTATDYLTVSRASQDRNAWSLSNRWFHIDVINATAEYNNTVAVLDNQARAKRPIIEFRPGLRLWNMGTQAKQPVDVIDFSQSDALSNVQGATEYSVHGYALTEGTRVIFAADVDPLVKNQVYEVSFISPDTVSPLMAQPIIHLTAANDGLVLPDQTVRVQSTGPQDQAGKIYWFDGQDWRIAQQKTQVQQAPLFDIYDQNGISYGDQSRYQSSSFAGSKLFGYAVGESGLIDPVLKFPLQYLNINNVGDIVFENNLYTDTFVYVLDNSSTEQLIASGHAKEYSGREEYTKLIGWQSAAVQSSTRQQFKFEYAAQPLVLDVRVNDVTSNVPAVKVFVDSVFLDSSAYTYTRTNNTTTIEFTQQLANNALIEVSVISDQPSSTAFYQVPSNLESNPLNGNSDTFTLGTIRAHYESICQNLVTRVGTINGANNTRDLGNIGTYGQVILQQSAPLTLAGYFLRSSEYNVFAALEYNAKEYSKFKFQLLDSVTNQSIQFETAAELLDNAVEEVTAGRVETQPFYWSDMLPSGAVYNDTTYRVGNVTTTVFDTLHVYNYTSAGYAGMNVYLNDQILIRGVDYTVATDGPRIDISRALTIGDTVTIREYESTRGSFVPSTPTKLGLYPAFEPGILTVAVSDGTAQVIQGHDGSLTPLFGDIRDQVLLEFETRVFNNLKLDGNAVPLTVYDVLPGQFRTTGFSYQEVMSVLGNGLLNYVGGNKLDYRSQLYDNSNSFTWNYSTATSKLDNQPLLGAWRGIYRYFYDTEQPQYTPWKMLGIGTKPTWWESVYGPAPYTSGNQVLWDDLEAGRVADPAGQRLLPEFARPGLSKIIPVDSEGNLISPVESVVSLYNELQFQRSWAVGDGGPTEASWWNSSFYPFAVMRLLAVSKPAKFFALFADRDLYRFNTEYGQYLYKDRYRLATDDLEIYGNGTSKASYINWIVDYNRQVGVDSTQRLTQDLASLDVRLCYRMASFSDKKYIKLYAERSSPDSQNSSLMIPDESYDLLLYKNQQFDRASYSAVVIQKVSSGYAVFGYSTTQPYFTVLQSRANGRLQTIGAGGINVRVATESTGSTVQVPYGFVLLNETSVCDFLLSYGRFLTSQGLRFDNTSNGYVLDWSQMCQEFLYWSQQGWSENALLNINPLALRLNLETSNSVVDSIQVQTTESALLDQNRRELSTRNLNIVRVGNSFSVEPLTDQTLSYIDLKFTSFEHMIVLNNRSAFGDLIYDPVTGARQSRLKLSCVNTDGWTGQINAPGFILNQRDVEEWTGLRTYSKGEIVKYKNSYWSALTMVQPSSTFEFANWTQSDYTEIEQGLLPNLANKADQLTSAYDINQANIEQDADILAFGLIGFRPRQYMASLNLDDVSQVNVYRQFISTKGTTQSATAFANANLGKESADYDIYENWAVQRAVYGATANRSFVELLLDQASLTANPSTVQVINPGQASSADQPVLLNNVWKQSRRLTSTDFLPVADIAAADQALPTAGYVNLDDADITLFDLSDLSNLSANLDQIGDGTSVWVAKTDRYNWNIYRAESVPGTIVHVCDNLDGTSRVIFTQQHTLAAGDQLIVKYFDSEVNGVYQVLSAPSLDTVNIEFAFDGDRTVANGTGLGYTLRTMRVAQPSDIVNLPYAQQLPAGARAWVDNGGDGRWQVLQKNDVFSAVSQLRANAVSAGEKYGRALAQSADKKSLLVGSPLWNVDQFGVAPGAVYLYVDDQSPVYNPVSPLPTGDAILNLNATGVRGFGNSIVVGDSTWAAVGASASTGSDGSPDNGYVAILRRNPAAGQSGALPYVVWQLLTPPGSTESTSTGSGEFGYSLAMSADEKWLYVSAPALQQVHAYTRVDVDAQSVRARGNGITTLFPISQAIKIYQPTQIRVLVDGQLQTLGVDYMVVGGSIQGWTVQFTTAPAEVLISIDRLTQQAIDSGNYYAVTADSTSGSGSGAEFVVSRLRGTATVGISVAGQNYQVNDTLTISGEDFGSVEDLTVEVSAINLDGGITGVTVDYNPVLINSFDLSKLFYTATSIDSFVVTVDNVIYRPGMDYSFVDDSGIMTFAAAAEPPRGATVLIQAQSHYAYVDTIQALPFVFETARFGQAISCSTDGQQLLIGAPNDTVESLDQPSTLYTQAGAVFVYDRAVQQFVCQNTDRKFVYAVDTAPVGPVRVKVNGEFVPNQDTVPLAVEHTFKLDSNNNWVILSWDPAVGDTVEIETNEYFFLQEVSDPVPSEFSNFGSAVDLCSNNCSLYVGEPNSSQQILKGGQVHRNVNQSKTYGITSSSPAGTDQWPSIADGQTIRVNYQTVAVPSEWTLGQYTKNTVVYQTDGTEYVFSVALSDTSADISDAGHWKQLSTVVSPEQQYTLYGLALQIAQQVSNVSAAVSAPGVITVSVKNPAAAQPGDLLTVLPGIVDSCFEELDFRTYVHVQTINNPYPVEYAGFGSAISIDTDASAIAVSAPASTMIIVTEFDQSQAVFDDGSTSFVTTVEQSGVVYTFDYLNAVNESVTNPGKFVFGQQITTPVAQRYDTFGASLDYTSGVLMVGAPNNDLGTAADYGTVIVYSNPEMMSAWQPIRRQNAVVDIRLINSVFTYNKNTSSRSQLFDFFDPLQGKILGAAKQNIDYITGLDPAVYNAGNSVDSRAAWNAAQVGQVWWDTSTVRFIDPNQDDISYAARRWGQVFPGSSVDVYQWVSSSVPPAAYTGPGVPVNTVNYSVNSRLNQDGLFVVEYYFWARGITTTAISQGKTLSVDTVARYIENPRGSGISYLAPLNANTVAVYNFGDSVESQDTVLHIEYDRELNSDNVHVEYELIAQGRPDAFVSNNLYRKLQDSFCGVDTAGNPVPDLGLSPAEQYGVQFRPRQSMFVDRFAALKNYLSRVNSVLLRHPISESRSLTLLNSKDPVPQQVEIVNGTPQVQWDLQLLDMEVLTYQDLSQVADGYRYLVLSDNTNNGRWAIYQVQDLQLVLDRVQSYNTADFWEYVDWYRPGYNPSTKVVRTVPNIGSLNTVSVPVGSTVKVTANAQGKFEIYQLLDTGWQRQALQNGTVRFLPQLWDYQLGRFGFDTEVFDAQYFDQEPTVETRKIIQAINQELLIDDLLIERNRALSLIFDFVLSESRAPEWLIKTSLIDVDHRIRDLVPYRDYRRDNQEFVRDYIKEVKPYHVQIREFNLRYSGFDQFFGDATDFDVPAYYNTSLPVPQYTSPVLLPYSQTAELGNNVSNVLAQDPIWTQFPYSEWYNNHLLTVEQVQVISGGSGYIAPPVVTFVGDAAEPAQGVAEINSLGQVSRVVVTFPGSGYTQIPTVVFNGSGSGARAIARATNSTTRSFRTTIKYDRVQYQSNVQPWVSGQLYSTGSRVRYLDRVWQATDDTQTQVFDLSAWQTVDAGTLLAADRVMGMYVPGANQPGVELPLLIDGIDYPGVQVYGDYFLGSNQQSVPVLCTQTVGTANWIVCENTIGLRVQSLVKFIGPTLGGIVSGAPYFVHSVIDSTKFRIALSPGNFPVTLTTDSGSMNMVLPAVLDADYHSRFADLYLGTRATDINVTGGKFISPVEAHGPEELVNGSEFDTVDIKVHTRPGSDWGTDGHGFQVSAVRYQYSPDTQYYSWANTVEIPVQVLVSNQTTGRDLVVDRDFTVQWATQTIQLQSGVSAGDTLDISVYEIGGGSQLYRTVFAGSDHNTSVVVPVASDEIYQVAVFRNGRSVDTVTWQSAAAGSTQVDFGTTFDSTDGIALVVMGLSQLTIPADQITVGATYRIAFPGDTNWLNLGVPVAAEFTAAIQGTQLVVSGPISGQLQVGQQLSGVNVLSGTTVTAINGSQITVLPAQVIAPAQAMVSYDVTQPFVATAPAVSTPSMGQVIADHSWSTPQVDVFVVDTSAEISRTFELTIDAGGTNPANMIVTKNGLRLRPSSGTEWIADGVETSYSLPTRTGVSQQLIYAPTDIQVWVNGILQTQTFGPTVGQYAVTPWSGSEDRQVVFAQALPVGARILITVSVLADYAISGNVLQINSAVSVSDVISVIGWNDTQQQNALTLTFQGPDTQGITLVEPYDATDYDTGTVSNESGSYDYSTGVEIARNNFWLQRDNVEASRLWVTLDGKRLFEGEDFVVQGEFLVLDTVINGAQVLAVTQFTGSIVPEAVSFRIFQDMRGVQATYRMPLSTATQLTQPLTQSDDTVHVVDASRLSEPDLENGVFGVITVGAERIMYRERNTAANTVSGLRRGTAGTGASAHAVGTRVDDMSRGNLLLEQYQDKIERSSMVADGNQTVFAGPAGVTVTDARAVQVYVGGTQVDNWAATSLDTVEIEFDVAPPAGVEVAVLIRQAQTWYQINSTLSLQESPTLAARFLTAA